MSEKTWGGARYLLTFTDEFSRKSFGYLLKNKYEVLQKLKEFEVLVENQTNLNIKKLRTDNGGEYCSNAFGDYMKSCGIIHETTIPHCPQQNGVAERLIGLP
ncbi:hypothetical protein JTB14_001248 [Gonioctena quinquepunctata]|nr:hypothetical protein JTB14_001248 [Gonioctena quinquepunctata]